MTKSSEHLQWIHDRCINVYHESKNVDFLKRLREIIEDVKRTETYFDENMKFYNKEK